MVSAPPPAPRAGLSAFYSDVFGRRDSGIPSMPSTTSTRQTGMISHFFCLGYTAPAAHLFAFLIMCFCTHRDFGFQTIGSSNFKPQHFEKLWNFSHFLKSFLFTAMHSLPTTYPTTTHPQVPVFHTHGQVIPFREYLKISEVLDSILRIFLGDF